jgi:hypothetical protein
MHLNLPAFVLGVHEELEKASRCWEGHEPVPGKKAYSEDSCRPKGSGKKEKEKKAFDANSMPSNENILPNLSNQAKWKYVRTKDALKLSDGNLVYSFGGFSDKYPSEDTRVTRGADDNILDFEKDLESKGTAQIHRASPDNIYMTLANGADNPTFMLQHESGKNWRYSPSKKFVEKLKALETAVPDGNVTVDPGALMEGAADQVKQAYIIDIVNPHVAAGLLDSEGAANLLTSGVHGLENFGKNYMQMHRDMPVASTVSGYALNKLTGGLLDSINPAREVRRVMDPSVRNSREIVPLAAAAVPAIAAHMFQ